MNHTNGKDAKTLGDVAIDLEDDSVNKIENEEEGPPLLVNQTLNTHRTHFNCKKRYRPSYGVTIGLDNIAKSLKEMTKMNMGMCYPMIDEETR